MNEKKRLPIRYEVTTYCPGGEVEAKSLDADELRTVSVQDYHHSLSLVWSTYGYRTADGEWIERPIDGCGLGKTGLSIIRALQLNAGEFLVPRDFAELIGNWNLLNPSTLAARLTKIRAAHNEDGDHQRFFLSRRNGGYAIKWDDFSWIWIDRIPEL